jgi:hypothetical protein
MQEDPRDRAVIGKPLKHRMEDVALAVEKLAGKIFADQGPRPAGRSDEDTRCGQVEILDRENVDPNQNDRIAGGSEQEPIAGLDLAQLPIITLHRLLGLDEARLQLGHSLQAPADRDQTGILAQAHRGILDGPPHSRREDLVDLSESGDAEIPRVVDETLQALAPERLDRVGPRTPDPRVHYLGGDRRRERRPPDHARVIE